MSRISSESQPVSEDPRCVVCSSLRCARLQTHASTISTLSRARVRVRSLAASRSSSARAFQLVTPHRSRQVTKTRDRKTRVMLLRKSNQPPLSHVKHVKRFPRPLTRRNLSQLPGCVQQRKQLSKRFALIGLYFFIYRNRPCLNLDLKV